MLGELANMHPPSLLRQLHGLRVVRQGTLPVAEALQRQGTARQQPGAGGQLGGWGAGYDMGVRIKSEESRHKMGVGMSERGQHGCRNDDNVIGGFALRALKTEPASAAAIIGAAGMWGRR